MLGFGTVWRGQVRSGGVRVGLAVPVWFGRSSQGVARKVWFGLAVVVRLG